jgi:hypothetical protein
MGVSGGCYPNRMANVVVRQQRLKMSVPFDIERWREHGLKLKNLGASLQWAIGDWLIAGEPYFTRQSGDPQRVYAEAASLTGYPPSALYNLVWLAGRFPAHSLRREEQLSYGHHKQLARASFTDKDIITLRDQAIANAWTIEELVFHIERYIEDKERARLARSPVAGPITATPGMDGTSTSVSPDKPDKPEKKVTVPIQFTKGERDFLKRLGKARGNIPASWVVRRIVQEYVIPNKDALLEEIEQSATKRKAEREAKKARK